ncbi:helix-turn-helix domain-containing protein [Dysosmobacter sp.]|uniref:helix-turn-helix domain-containing protein n=1 Tax=Dysosmobacter sp. TaxID=2591382 RepID=UPI002A92E32F|nr:helix-turn-helix domain-containing protein [Dysosmobacter sp.]MCI6055161.1 helix-turn-helix domain-containing protein [Dysosmobacter sp.]MDY5510444.1 helix-turn-helix domain-containing protein [Dysosmobacter sp.]
MTIGQRVGQKRKELGLSQEALGEQLGVSRQSIYKWESDSALPEIDKLIALSRLFGVSVGWLLGVEEPPQDDGADAESDPEAGELTEAQLRMVEEIVARYTAALPKAKRRRWPFVLAGVVLFFAIFNLFSELNALRSQQGSISSSIAQVQNSVDRQIGSISSRVEEILKAQNSLVADYGVELTAVTPAHNTATFTVHAVPKTYVEGMTVEFIAENGEVASDRVAKAGEIGSNQRFYADLSVPLTDSITISALLISPDGTRQTQLLDQFHGLYSDTLPAVDVQSNFMWMDLEDGALVLTENSHERYLWTQEQIWSDSAAAIADVRVGLFKNRQLAAWAEPCEQPDSFHGFEDCSFYCLPELHLDLTAQDTVEVAAVVTDTYGRTTICQDVPYVPDAEAAELVHPDISSSDSNPANWHY